MWVVNQLVVVHIVVIKELVCFRFRIEFVTNLKRTHVRHVEVGTVLALIVVKTFKAITLLHAKVFVL